VTVPVILVDTSVWIELVNRWPPICVEEERLYNLATCGPVVQEVLQGLREHSSAAAFRAAFLALPVLGDPLSIQTFQAAAEIYRLGRSKGYTVRSSADCLIAAIAIEHQVPVWHQDRDFDLLSRFTTLQIHHG